MFAIDFRKGVASTGFSYGEFGWQARQAFLKAIFFRKKQVRVFKRFNFFHIFSKKTSFQWRPKSILGIEQAQNLEKVQEHVLNNCGLMGNVPKNARNHFFLELDFLPRFCNFSWAANPDFSLQVAKNLCTTWCRRGGVDLVGARNQAKDGKKGYCSAVKWGAQRTSNVMGTKWPIHEVGWHIPPKQTGLLDGKTGGFAIFNNKKAIC